MSTAISKDKRPSALSTATDLRLPWDESIGQEFGVDRTKWRALTETKFASAQSSATVILALAYCKARNIDPMKGLIHIVPVWSKDQKKYVDTIWPGIGEIRTTAFRTGQYAGRAATVYGRDITQDLGGVEMTFPEWAQITVKRMVSGVPVEFSGPRVYWIEAYSTAKHDTDAPNDMWRNRPRGQLEKCAEAAALRAAFPEEVGSDYCADEIRTYERGAVVIDSPEPARPKKLSELSELPAIEGPQVSEEMQAVFDKAIKGLGRASEPKHIEWFDNNISWQVFDSWTDEMQKQYTEKKREATERIKPETPEQAFRRCLAEIGPMDAKAANAHIKTFDSGDWVDEWHFELNQALEAKGAK